MNESAAAQSYRQALESMDTDQLVRELGDCYLQTYGVNAPAVLRRMDRIANLIRKTHDRYKVA